jgi:hypothetical protein
MWVFASSTTTKFDFSVTNFLRFSVVTVVLNYTINNLLEFSKLWGRCGEWFREDVPVNIFITWWMGV